MPSYLFIFAAAGILACFAAFWLAAASFMHLREPLWGFKLCLASAGASIIIMVVLLRGGLSLLHDPYQPKMNLVIGLLILGSALYWSCYLLNLTRKVWVDIREGNS